MRYLNALLVASACCAALLPEIAAAQTATIGEVIVTARKRNESILNVPVIETAIGNQALERRQTQDLKDIEAQVPGLSLGDAVLTIGTQVSLRGVGTTTLDAGVDQSVSLNLDGLQLSQGLAYSSGLFDVQQVEVLKGPQALFYGKNSPGGVIALRTEDPTKDVQLIARGAHEFDANEYRGELILSGPVTDTLGLRFSSAYDSSDGFFRNEAVPAPGTGAAAPEYSHGPHDRNYILRGTALWRPDPKFSARLKTNYTNDRSIESGEEEQVSCPNGFGGVAPLYIPFLGGPNETCMKGDSYSVVSMDPAAFPGIRNNGQPFLDTTQEFGTLELNYLLRPDLTLTSTTGYYHVRSDGLINGVITTYAGTPIVADNHFRRQEKTEEIRLNSDFTGPLNFTTGAFYENGHMFNDVDVLGDTAYKLPATLVAGTHDIHIESISFFGQLRYKILPPLELAAGARYTDERRGDTPYNTSTGTAVPTDIPKPKESFGNVSPEVTLTYKPYNNITVFGSYKQGFKSGSYNITVPATAGLDNSFGEEHAEGFETGLKSLFLNRRLAMNAALYDYQYRGLQVGVNQPQPGNVPELRTLNAGSALVYGFDYDIAYRPEFVEGLNLHASMEGNHARFKRLDDVPCYGGQTIANGCNEALNSTTGFFTAQNLSGIPLERAPNWQVNAGVDYDIPLSRDYVLSLSNSENYSSKYLANLGRRADFYQNPYIKADFTATLKGPGDHWELALIGKDLNNALSSGNCVNVDTVTGNVFGGQVTGGTGRGPAGVDDVACFVDRGREVWIRATLKPFG